MTVRGLSICAIAAAGLLSGAQGVTAQGLQPSGLAETLVTKGRPKDGIVACQACHRGAGQGDASFGNLTGLTKEYFAKQLKDFQSGARENRVMQGLTANLTDAEIEALALYYSGLQPK